MTKEVAANLLLDMVEAIQAKDKGRFRELLSQKVAIKNAIMVDEYLKNKYIAVLTGALGMLMEEADRLPDRLTELDEMITLQQKEKIKRTALQRQVTFEQVVRDAIDAYLRHNSPLETFE